MSGHPSTALTEYSPQLAERLRDFVSRAAALTDVQAAVEANHDDNGPIWPEAVAPFRVGLINLKVGDAACDGACSRIYDSLGKAGVDVLYDDRDDRPGAKFATMDLVGAPHQAIVGPKSLAEGKVELKSRRGGERELISVDAAIARLGGQA